MIARGFVLLALVLAGCTQKVDGYCCTDADCDSIVECADPARPFCDNAGEFPASNGVGRTCIGDPLTSACDGPEDCTNQERPFCLDGMCVQCTEGSECAADAPVCDDGTHLCGACTMDGDCDGRAEARCFTDDGVCVACLEATDCPLMEAPVCDDTDHACRGCIADAECASDVCNLATGECVAEADVIYLEPGGTGATCTSVAPCGTFAAGLALVTATKKTIKVGAGSYDERVAIPGLTVDIVGPGADVHGTVVGPLFDITGDAEVSIRGLRIHEGAGTTGDGVRCTDSTGNPTVTLSAVTVDTNGGKGITATGCALTVTRSVIRGNTAGGVVISAGTFTLTNNWIVGNGVSTLPNGGVTIQNTTGTGAHVLDFNTIADNNSSASFPGVSCGTIGGALTFANNIIYANESAAQVGGDLMCTHAYSNIGPIAESGTGNINMAPDFVGAGTGDFHLAAGSPGIDVADMAAALTIDLDGDDRPQNGRSDMGADEVVP